MSRLSHLINPLTKPSKGAILKYKCTLIDNRLVSPTLCCLGFGPLALWECSSQHTSWNIRNLFIFLDTFKIGFLDFK